MKKFHSLTACALIAPVMTFGISSAYAQTSSSEADSAQQQQQRTLTEQAQKDRGMSTAERASQDRMAEQRSHPRADAEQTYLSSKPSDSFKSDELIGSDLKSQADDESIGTVSDVLIDEDGQIVAVIVGVGGFLGMGEKDVAIAWDAVEKRRNEDGDGYEFMVSSNKEALKNAPEYDKNRPASKRWGQMGAAQSEERRPGAQQRDSSESKTAHQPGERTEQKSSAGEQLSRAPSNAFHTDSLLGQDVRTEADDRKAGTINDIVIDEDGQVIAVVVGIGGVLGIGQRNVAISWDALQRNRDSDGDSKFTTSMSRDALRDAPDYDRDADAADGESERRRSN